MASVALITVVDQKFFHNKAFSWKTQVLGVHGEGTAAD
ncbi:hypothetical protein HBHAL_2349 [Halobacillus halophilus DSM 2266]|uniref:Uncharacterized protein n=1 Tax=Halobacillus halophilus (strain ATCC 35676 / DSM 2266 / JCM 20832 / KCTC 3685 / LMG 17431 / NBRC 102448 / NCIMB 2269) TaxID=866895 RepID=I0JKM6_HALH3|nr:hypothetical protein HBHAL_2349 [Halobacillus halophilus DSM 2266]